MKALEVWPLGYIEEDFEARTKLGKWRISARQGWAGENDGFFSTGLEECHAGIRDGRIILVGNAPVVSQNLPLLRINQAK